MSAPSPNADPALAQVLAGDRRRSRWRWAWLALALLLAAAGAGTLWLRSPSSDERQAASYVTEAVRRGDLTVTVSATGTLQPTNKVDIGSELSGIVEAVLVDDNDRVRKGQVLARLDLSKLNDQIRKSEAHLASAEAKVEQLRATVAEARANLARLEQVAELSGGKVPSKAELDTGAAALQRALADEAAARAAVAEAQAALSSDRTNLSKAHIRSPIDGVVLARKVDPGQTVAASFQAPVLFTLAENLSQMQLEVDVDEADVGQVREGQSATFNVDAYPARHFPARVTRVGLGSQVKDGVVSYLTVLSVDNDDLSLRPGMTGTAQITVARREGVLLVPNAALRFSPPAKPAARTGGLVGSLIPRPPRSTSQRAAVSGKEGGARVWVLREGQPVAVPVTLGATDGSLTELTGGDLQPGAQVITEYVGTRQ